MKARPRKGLENKKVFFFDLFGSKKKISINLLLWPAMGYRVGRQVGDGKEKEKGGERSYQGAIAMGIGSGEV